MTSLWKKWTASVPGPFLTALLLAGAFMLFVAWDQSHWWKSKDDYSFGWLVPAFVAFIVYDRWSKTLGALRDCAAPDSPRASGGAASALSFLVYSAMVCAVLLFAVGALYRAGVGASYPGTFTLSFSTGFIVLTLLFLFAPEPAAGGKPVSTGILGDARVKLVAPFLFPAFVWLVSAPMLSTIEDNLSHFMLGRVAAIVFFVFDTLGLAIEQQGNVLKLPLGDVGVEDACSGIRSFTACLFAGSFLSAVFLDKLWKKITLVVAAVFFAFFTNILRSLFLTAWAYNYGPAAIEGKVHDIAGYAVLGLTVIGLLCMLPLFNLTFVTGNDHHEPHDETGAGGAPHAEPKAT